MPKARYYKSLFLPDLNGQYKIWKRDCLPVINKVDEIFQLGNIIGCSERMKSKQIGNYKEMGPNAALMHFIMLWRATYPNWVQLCGPNEIMALNFPDEWMGEQTHEMLRTAWFVVPRSNEGTFGANGYRSRQQK